MVASLEVAIARIYSNSGKAIGAGFLVSDKYVLTCAHVVAFALGIRADTPNLPTGKIYLDFPRVDAGRKIEAKVIFWLPVNPDLAREDIAGLELLNPIPDNAHPVRLLNSEDLWGHQFRVFGFPEGKSNGVWASGVLRGGTAKEWVQLEDVKETGYRLDKGFSGAPVWDEELQGVVGMAVAAEQQRQEIKVAFIIPANVLVQVWEVLRERAIASCPYRGLFAFREEDAQFFFGRKVFTEQLVAEVAQRQLVAVIGASGSGKSSVVFAGLIPQLREQGGWLIESFRPGDCPFRNLAARLLPLLEGQMSETDRLAEVKKLTKKLDEGELIIGDVLERIVEKRSGERLLLVADQFEELYTLCREDAERQRFLDGLLEACDRVSRLTLVLTLRADFLSYALSYRPFADALQNADVKLAPMNEEELREVVEMPADKLGIRLESGLTERILEDVEKSPGNLPLLEFALEQLWRKQENGSLTHEAYDAIGGVEKGLAQYAEEVYEKLGEEDRERAQRVFIQLVRPGEGTEDTRRLATRGEVGEANWDLVTRLASDRLVVTSCNETGEETVEVIHEALIREWGTLRKWMNDNREFRTWQERLKVRIQEWEKMSKDEEAFLRGASLFEAKDWQQQRGDELSQSEQEFIVKSLEHWNKEKEELERKRKRTILGLSGISLVALILASIAGVQWQLAEYQSKVSRARELAAKAQLLKNQEFRLLPRSLLLAIESMQRFPSLEADQSLRSTLALFPRSVATFNHKERVDKVTFSSDGKYLATASGNTSIVWEINTRKKVIQIEHKNQINTIALSPNKKYLATGSDETVIIWDINTGNQISYVRHDTGGIKVLDRIETVIFSSTSKYVIAKSREGKIKVLGLTKQNIPKYFNTNDEKSLNVFAISSNAQYIAIDQDEKIQIVDVSNQRAIADLTKNKNFFGAIFSSDNRYIAIQTIDGAEGKEKVVIIWDIIDNKKVSAITAEEFVYSVEFSPDSKHLITSSGNPSDGGFSSPDIATTVWETNTGKEIVRIQTDTIVSTVTFSPDGKYLATLSKEAQVWELASGKEIFRLKAGENFYAGSTPVESNIEAVEFSPDSKYLATGNLDKTAQIWELSNGGEVNRINNKNFYMINSNGQYIIELRDASVNDSLMEIRESMTNKIFDYLDFKVLFNFISNDKEIIKNKEQFKEILKFMNILNKIYISDMNHDNPFQFPTFANEILFSPDSKYIVTANNSKIKIWNIDNNKNIIYLKHTLKSDEGRASMTLSSDSKFLASLSFSIDSQTAITRIWDIYSGKELQYFEKKIQFDQNVLADPQGIHSVIFSPNRRYLITVPFIGTEAHIWDLKNGKLVLNIHYDNEIHDVSFSADNKYLAITGARELPNRWITGEIQVFQLANGKKIFGYQHDTWGEDIAFSSDGKYLAAADGVTARIFEVSSGAEVIRINHEYEVVFLQFNPDGKFLITTASDGITRVWKLHSKDLITEACQRLARNLTQEEWQQYFPNEKYHKTCPNLP
ncbi:MAG: trypsin-like peptidase domain-containing protein [Cyanobacteria bacterium SBLK]|nr:trypsin-like peptidase domain-containing protein [Cyanobacteria bacterium SBLK]